MSPMPATPIIITPGEPAGIGAEISLKAWQAGMKNICLMGEPDHIARTAQSLGIKANFMTSIHHRYINLTQLH